MGKITQEAFLNNIQEIINEGMNTNEVVDNTKKFGIRRYVVGLLEAGLRNPKLMTYLNNYNNMLNNSSIKEFMVYEKFGQGLAQYASGNKDVKNVINEMNNTLALYGTELEAHMLIEQIQDPAAQDAVKIAYDNYLQEEDDAARNILIDAVDMVDQQGDPVAPKLLIVITTDATSRLPQIELGTSESKFDEIQAKIKEEKERKRLEDIKDKVDAYAKQVFADAAAEKQAECDACTFENIVNNNGLNLRESIKNIVSSDAKSNKRLMETIEQYAGALNQGLYEERLYEGFLQNISKFNYLLPVEKEINRINEVAKENAASIIVTKLLEEMQDTPSYYIVYLIEEDAARYVKNPNAINRVQLRNALCSFAADPYCHAMLEAIERDGSMIANTLEEKAMAVKDQIKVIRENANISTIYSPVQYIKENECVFNANGQFYVKKGNTLAKLNTEYVNLLSENFVALCQLVNDPRVTINNDSITLVGGDKVAMIYEGYVDINGCRETTDTLRNLNEMCMKYDYDTNFFVMASCLHEHFNDIAIIDFGKHIALNEDEGINVDMFRLGNNIFINTINENVDKSTFYHNVNPMQCRNIINKHMGMNVASLFEDLIPSQEKILLKLNEMKSEYEDSIEKYESVLVKLKKAKDECVSKDNEKKLNDAIETTKTKLEEIKKEYKDWQKNVKKETDVDTNEKSDDNDTEVETTNEPIDKKDVEDAKDELTEPIANDENQESEEDNNQELTDDEFNSYLEGETDVPEVMKNQENSEESEEETEENTENTEETEENTDDKKGFTEVNIDNLNSEEENSEEENSDNEINVDEPINVESGEELPDSTYTEDVLLNDSSCEEETTVPEGYKIVNIAFDQNVKTKELFKTGTISVVCPMVDGDGRMYVQSSDYNFYIDENTNMPIIDAGGIPVALYNALVDSITNDATYNKAVNSDEHKQWYDAKDVNKISDKLEKDDDEYFSFEENPEGITITPKDEETVIPTYKSDDEKTDIELPAPNVDNTDIPENTSKEELTSEENTDEETENAEENTNEETENKEVEENVKVKKPISESILSIKSVIKKNGKDFFLSEGTIKPSKKEVSQISEATANIDGTNNLIEEPIEEYNEQDDTNTLEILHTKASNALDAISKENVIISDIQKLQEIPCFELSDNNNSYTIYQLDNKIYYRPTQDFYNILKDIDDNILDIESLKYENDRETLLNYYNVLDVDNCLDIIDAILLTFGIYQNENVPLDESIKVRRPKLSCEGDLEKSKKYDDILHGDEELRKFEENVEKETLKEGLENPLVPLQELQESVKQILPNVHNTLIESTLNEKKENIEYIYEPLDWVVIKENGMKAQVNCVLNDGDGKLKMLTVLASNGIIYDVNPNEIEPDPSYIENIPGRVVNSQKLYIPTKATFDIDPETRLNKKPENEKPVTMADLNGRTLPVDIVVEGYKLNSESCSAFLEDIANSKKDIRVINENGEISTYNVENNIQFNEWPYAVIVNSEGKPVRTILVNPECYINANEDDLVDCKVAGKDTKYPKKVINILS